MAFPLTGTARSGTVRVASRPLLPLTATRTWNPSRWPRTGLVQLYRVGPAPIATGAATTVQIGATGEVLVPVDADVQITVALSGDGLVTAPGNASLDVTADIQAEGQVFDRAADITLPVSVEITAAGAVSFAESADLQLSITISASGRVRLVELPPALAVPQVSAASWW